MPGRIEGSDADVVDIGKRYDIYIARGSTRDSGTVVFRNAFFRGGKGFEKAGHYQFWNDYVEIEQSDGSTVFVRQYSLIWFCEAGTKLTCEAVSPAG